MLMPLSKTSTALTVVSKNVMFKSKSSFCSGLANIGSLVRWSMSSLKDSWHFWGHLFFFVVVQRNWKNNMHLSETLEIKCLIAATCLFSCWTSFKVEGGFMKVTVNIFLGFVLMLSFLIWNPKNLLSVTPKQHFYGLSLKPKHSSTCRSIVSCEDDLVHWTWPRCCQHMSGHSY